MKPGYPITDADILIDSFGGNQRIKNGNNAQQCTAKKAKQYLAATAGTLEFLKKIIRYVEFSYIK